jgi:hypothetical protein
VSGACACAHFVRMNFPEQRGTDRLENADALLGSQGLGGLGGITMVFTWSGELQGPRGAALMLGAL